MFKEAISEKEVVVNWVEDFLKKQPVFVKDEKGNPFRKAGIPFTKKDVEDFLIFFNITKDNYEIRLTLSFMERDTSLFFNDYKILRLKKTEEAPESYFESGCLDFELRKLKEKVNTLQKDLSKAVSMKKEDWKRKEILIEL